MVKVQNSKRRSRTLTLGWVVMERDWGAKAQVAERVMEETGREGKALVEETGWVGMACWGED